MQDQRKHKRFGVDTIKIRGRMVFARKVDVVDISMSGIALRADKRLEIGREYLIQLEEGGKSISIKGVVVRSSLSGAEKRSDAEVVPIYTAGLIFKEEAGEKIAHFLDTVKHRKKEAVPIRIESRQSGRFRIVASGNADLSFPVQYKVMEISLAGMLVQTDQALVVESIVPMELSLLEGEVLTFKGRVTLCREMSGKGRPRYEVGVEFLDLKGKGIEMLKSFVDYLAETKAAKVDKQNLG